MTTFEWSDAWILMASIRATREFGSPSLDQLLAWSDAINNAIPTTSELSGAFTRLVAAGLATRNRDAIVPTRKALWLNRRLNWWRRSAFDGTQALAKALERIPVPDSKEPLVVSEQELQTAFERYERYASAIAAKIIGDLTGK